MEWWLHSGGLHSGKDCIRATPWRPRRRCALRHAFSISSTDTLAAAHIGPTPWDLSRPTASYLIFFYSILYSLVLLWFFWFTSPGALARRLAGCAMNDGDEMVDGCRDGLAGVSSFSLCLNEDEDRRLCRLDLEGLLLVARRGPCMIDLGIIVRRRNLWLCWCFLACGNENENVHMHVNGM